MCFRPKYLALIDWLVQKYSKCQFLVLVLFLWNKMMYAFLHFTIPKHRTINISTSILIKALKDGLKLKMHLEYFLVRDKCDGGSFISQIHKSNFSVRVSKLANIIERQK